jgi:hypothetical protein
MSPPPEVLGKGTRKNGGAHGEKVYSRKTTHEGGSERRRQSAANW